MRAASAKETSGGSGALESIPSADAIRTDETYGSGADGDGITISRRSVTETRRRNRHLATDGVIVTDYTTSFNRWLAPFRNTLSPKRDKRPNGLIRVTGPVERTPVPSPAHKSSIKVISRKCDPLNLVTCMTKDGFIQFDYGYRTIITGRV